MNKKVISGVLTFALAVGAIAPWQENGFTLSANSVTVFGESNSVVKLDLDGMEYSSIYQSFCQIPCETLGGIYILNEKKLFFYSMDDRKTTLVHTFEYYAKVFATDSKLYVLGYSYGKENATYTNILVYDLISQKTERTIEFDQKVFTVGADALGRIYLSGPLDSKYAIYLLSPEGELLSKTTSEQEIYGFSGFDSSNGNFYVDSHYNWVYWGFAHDMHAVRAGNVTGNVVSFRETVLQLVAQDYFYERQNQVELLGDKYLCVDSTFESGLYIWDSDGYSTKEEKSTCMATLKREKNNSGSFDPLESVGVRAVYRENSDTIIAFKDSASIAEYDPKTGEEIASTATSYPVFSLMEYKNGVVAIEKNGKDFYFEYFPWTNATTAQITASATTIKVGESLALNLVTDGSLTQKVTWTSSNPKLASVNKSGEVFAWGKGTVTISAKSKSGLNSEYTLSILENENIKNPKSAVITTSGKTTKNASNNTYTVWSKPVKSYLIENADKTLTRIEYTDKKVLVEQYASDGSTLQSSRTIDVELELFGGFYSGSDANYLVFGNKNLSESDTSEVLRVVKYSKDWNRISSCSVKGANTYIPFDAGSLRMTETNGRLYIHTCHEMYATDDGLHHQANMTFVVKESDLTIEQSYYDIMNIAQAGYVSHSFNQFIQTDGKFVYRVDHGDASPRAISITKCETDGSIEDVSYILAVDLSKVPGYNQTGVSVGGFALSTENCILAGNGIDFTKEDVDTEGIRNIFVNITDRELEQSETIWLTKYSSSDKIETGTPHLVKVGNDGFLVLWEETDTKMEETYTKLLTIDGNGTVISDSVAADMRLSDCEPILCSDGLVRWYAAENGSPVLYIVNPYDLAAAPVYTYKKENITKSIVKAVVSGISDETYSGAKIKPNIVVKLNGTTLEADTDYTVSFANNKNVGKAKVTIEGMGDYTGTITRYFYIKPKAANIISVKSSKKACIKVTWKKDPQVSGYRIVYATNSKFSKGKTFLTVKASKRSRTITKLSKGKKYYVKVQRYKTIDGKKIYGEYSKVRTVTVKRR